MPTEKPRITFAVDEELLNLVMSYKTDSNCKNLSQAVLSLIGKGLEIVGAQPALSNEAIQGGDILHNRIRQIRGDMSAIDFSNRLGISRQGLKKLETGLSSPSEQTIRAICSEFRINRKWLETGEGEMRAPSDDAQDLIARMTAEHNLGPDVVMPLRAVARIFAELGPEKTIRILDEELPPIKRELVTDPTLIAAERASVPDPEAKTSD